LCRARAIVYNIIVLHYKIPKIILYEIFHINIVAIFSCV